jgi:excisionase family DNA binding protein
MTAKEAAEKCKCSVSMIYQLAAEGRLPHYRIGRLGRRGKVVFDEEDVRKFLESCRVTPAVEPPKQQLKHLQL